MNNTNLSLKMYLKILRFAQDDKYRFVVILSEAKNLNGFFSLRVSIQSARVRSFASLRMTTTELVILSEAKDLTGWTDTNLSLKSIQKILRFAQDDRLRFVVILSEAKNLKVDF